MSVNVSQEDLFQTPGLQEELQSIIDCLDTSIPDSVCILVHEAGHTDMSSIKMRVSILTQLTHRPGAHAHCYVSIIMIKIPVGCQE